MANNELLDFFLAEAEEHIGKLEAGFLDLENSPGDTTAIHELFRSAHTLKGSAALVKLSTLSGIAHKMEDVLESARDGNLNVTKDIADWLFHCLDAIKLLIKDTVNGRPERAELMDEVCGAFEYALTESAEEPSEENEQIAAIASQEVPQSADMMSPEEHPVEETEKSDKAHESGPSPVSANDESRKEKRSHSRRAEDLDIASNFVKVNVDDLDKMMGLVGELTILKNYFTSEIDGIHGLRREIEYSNKRLLKEIEDFHINYAFSTPEKISYVDPLLEDFRELEFDRYDGINLFINSVKETTNDVNEALKSITAFFDQFARHSGKLEKLNLEFRELISSSRMVETGKLFQRLTLVVRDLCNQSGKQVSLYIKGGTTRIDKLLYERLFTPLLHVVRNAFSHGIEPPAVRRELGKPEEGSIMLSAVRDGSSVIIDIQDDGGGINLKKIYEKAVRMNMIKAGEQVSPARLLNLIFMPGFTTHDSTDMTSGRGVGLDAVRHIVSEMNGTLSIASEEKKGTIFRIRLPLSLIVVNTVKFRAGGLEFSVPSMLIKELVDINVNDFDRENSSIRLGERQVTAKELSDLLKIPSTRSGSRASVILFNLMPGKEAALLVDDVTEMEDTVIRPLGGFLRGLKCYSGFSITADGKIIPVLNPIRLLEEKHADVQQAPAHERASGGTIVLVVDDSLSVRKYAGMALEKKGFRVFTAPNGLEALTILEEKHVDVILTDLEMPVMHGYELLRELKRRGLSDTIPAIVLTSRSNEKHREKATQLGARDYIVKPFEEAALVETVRKHLAKLCPSS